MTESDKERTRQMNMRVTPQEYGELAILGALSELTPIEKARAYIKEGMERETAIPEVRAALDAAITARQALTEPQT
jgi:hypothetical protein